MVKYALLARGDAHLYLRFPRPGYEEKVWDHAAGSAVLLAAGGSVTDELGEQLPFGTGSLLKGVTGIVASGVPAEPHSKIIRVVAECDVPA
jgi:3'-phosphoadenosine 5'-phosphosulfate (PAPS) 3'-phosphatase